MFGILARLARQGFRVMPGEARDVIHDFVLEEMPRVERGFDEVKGAFEPYLACAFLRYARRWAVRQTALRQRLWDAHSLGEIAQEARPSGREAARQEALDALKSVSGRGQSLLEGFLSGTSERALARECGLTRHQTRQELVDAMGQATVRLASPADVDELDWDVANALWRDRLDLQQASRTLRRPLSAIRVANRRNCARIAALLTDRERAPVEDLVHTNLMETLERLLRSPDDPELRGSLAEHAETLRAQLAGDDVALDALDELASRLTAEQLGDLFGLLACDEGAPLSAEVQDELDAEELEVGEAFAALLMAGLPQPLSELEEWFEPELEVEPAVQAELLKDPSSRSAGEWAQRLARFGLTPLTILHATEAVSLLAERRAGDQEGSTLLPRQLGIDPGTPEDGLTPEALVREIGLVADCTPPLARALGGWLLEVAMHRPHLFEGFEATTEGLQWLRLAPSEEASTLAEQWGHAVAVPLALAASGETPAEHGKPITGRFEVLAIVGEEFQLRGSRRSLRLCALKPSAPEIAGRKIALVGSDTSGDFAVRIETVVTGQAGRLDLPPNQAGLLLQAALESNVKFGLEFVD